MAPTNQDKWRGNARVNSLQSPAWFPLPRGGPCQKETADSCLLLSQREEEEPTPLWGSIGSQRDKLGLGTTEQQRHWERGDSRWDQDLRENSPSLTTPSLHHHSSAAALIVEVEVGLQQEGPLKILII